MTAPANERVAGQKALLRFLQRQNRISTTDMLRIEEALQYTAGATVHELLEREGLIEREGSGAAARRTRSGSASSISPRSRSTRRSPAS